MSGPVRPLTARQLEVVAGLRRGLSYRAIAAEMGVTPRTVQGHVCMIAMLIPNPRSLPAGRLVMLWAMQSVN